jgi:hypothetical protein
VGYAKNCRIENIEANISVQSLIGREEIRSTPAIRQLAETDQDYETVFCREVSYQGAIWTGVRSGTTPETAPIPTSGHANASVAGGVVGFLMGENKGTNIKITGAGVGLPGTAVAKAISGEVVGGVFGYVGVGYNETATGESGASVITANSTVTEAKGIKNMSPTTILKSRFFAGGLVGINSGKIENSTYKKRIRESDFGANFEAEPAVGTSATTAATLTQEHQSITPANISLDLHCSAYPSTVPTSWISVIQDADQNSINSVSTSRLYQGVSVGGVCGFNKGKIEGVSLGASIYNLNLYSVGGIVGLNRDYNSGEDKNPFVSDCYVASGSLQSGFYAGGLIGKVNSSDPKLSGVYDTNTKETRFNHAAVKFSTQVFDFEGKLDNTIYAKEYTYENNIGILDGNQNYVAFSIVPTAGMLISPMFRQANGQYTMVREFTGNRDYGEMSVVPDESGAWPNTQPMAPQWRNKYIGNMTVPDEGHKLDGRADTNDYVFKANNPSTTMLENYAPPSRLVVQTKMVTVGNTNLYVPYTSLKDGKKAEIQESFPIGSRTSVSDTTWNSGEKFKNYWDGELTSDGKEYMQYLDYTFTTKIPAGESTKTLGQIKGEIAALGSTTPTKTHPLSKVNYVAANPVPDNDKYKKAMTAAEATWTWLPYQSDVDVNNKFLIQADGEPASEADGKPAIGGIDEVAFDGSTEGKNYYYFATFKHTFDGKTITMLVKVTITVVQQ